MPTDTLSRSDAGTAASAILFRPLRLGPLELRNRVAVAPMTRTSAAADGTATAAMVDYYADYARGGFGLVFSEGLYTDTAHSQGYENQPGLATAAQQESWRPVTDAVHAAGGRIIAQLMHAGAQAQANRFTDETVGPSAVAPKGEKLGAYGGSGPYATPRPLTADEIETVIAGFVESARRAVAAGFDGIEVHGANGYLVDQFLTDYLNRRDDGYGGSPEARVRLAVEIVRAVKAAVGDPVPVGIRLSQIKVTDPDHRWSGGEAEAAVIFSRLGEAGADFIHISENDATAPAFGEQGPPLSALVKQYAPVPVIVAGDLASPSTAAARVLSGDTDMVAIGKGALADPHWAAKVEAGERPIRFMPELFANGPTLAGVAAARASLDA